MNNFERLLFLFEVQDVKIIDIDFIIDIFSSNYANIIDGNIKEINKKIEKYGVELSRKNSEYTAFYFQDSNKIVLYINSIDTKNKDEFLYIAKSFLYHEMVHRQQYLKIKNKNKYKDAVDYAFFGRVLDKMRELKIKPKNKIFDPYDIDNLIFKSNNDIKKYADFLNTEYINDPSEIQAFAQQFALHLKSKYNNPKQELKKIQSMKIDDYKDDNFIFLFFEIIKKSKNKKKFFKDAYKTLDNLR